MNRKKYLIIIRYIFIVLLALFAIIAISSMYIVLKLGSGYYREGMEGFIADIVVRVFMSIVVIIFLIGTFFVRESTKTIVIWWICLIISIVGIFYALRAPILDLAYLNHPQSIKLDYVSFEVDCNHEYIVTHKLRGYTENGDIEIFDINSDTLDIEKEKWKDDENVLANVKYLPHTGVLMSYKTYREKSR